MANWFKTGLDLDKLRKEALEAERLLDGIGRKQLHSHRGLLPKIDVQSVKNSFKQIGDSVENEGSRIDGFFKKIGAETSITFTFSKATQFVRDIARVRGEFQQLEIAFETMLGSKQKADALMSQLVKTAAITPFDLKGVTEGAKQLLAYGISADNVNQTLTKLGDIAAGLSIPLNDLVYLYGTTMVQGRMFTQDLRQFMGRGIPIAEELAKQFGVAKKEVGELVSSGRVGAKEFNEAIMSMADGKFANLMEKQSKSITGQISNLKDSFNVMLNEMGQKSEGAISAGIEGANYLVDNYKKIGREIGGLVVAYGSYKAALMAVAAFQRMNMAVMREAVLVKQAYAAQSIKITTAEAIQQAHTNLLTIAKIRLIGVQKTLNKVIMSNPYVLAAAAVAGLVYGIYRLITAESSVEKAQRLHNESLEKAREKKDNLISKTNQLISVITDETSTIYQQVAAWQELKKEMPESFKNISFSEFKNMSSGERDKLINKAVDEKELQDFNKSLADAEKRVTAIKAQIEATYNTPNNSGMALYLSKQLSEAQELLRLKKEEKVKREELARIAEFESKSDKEKKIYYKEQLELLKGQYQELEKQVPENARIADSTKLTKTSLLNVKDGLLEINTEWEGFDWQTQQNILKLNSLNSQISQIRNNIASLESKPEQSYSDAKKQAKREYEEAKKELARIKKEGTKREYLEQKNILEAKEKAYKDLGGNISSPSKKTDYTSQLEKQKREAERAAKDLELQKAQSEIDAKNEGLVKILAQNELNYEKEKEQLKRQAEDLLAAKQEHERSIWESKGGKGKFKPTITSLTEEETSAFADMSKDAESKLKIENLKAEEAALKSLEEINEKVAGVVENSEKRKQAAIKNTYAEMRKAVNKMLEGGSITKKQYDELVPKIDKAEIKAQTEQILEGVRDYQSELDELNAVWQEKLEYDAKHNGGKLSKAIEKGHQEAVGALDVDFLKKSDEWVQLFGNLERLSVRELKRLRDIIKDKVKDMKLDPAIMKEINDGFKEVDKQIASKNPFEALADSIKKYNKESDEAAKKDAAKGIVASAGAIVQMVEGMFHQLKDGLKSLGIEMDEETEELTNGIVEMTSGAAQLAAGIFATNNPADIIAGSIKLLTSSVKVFDTKTRDANKAIKANKAELEQLDKAYKKLEKSIDDVYASDKVQHVEQLKRMKERQAELIKANIEAEKSKKNKDDKKIKEYENKLDVINDDIKKLGETAAEAIMGKSVKSAIDEFADAYVNAWAAGEDRANAVKDVVKKMIKSAVVELSKSKLKDSVSELYNTIKSAMSDGIITTYEENLIAQAEAMVNSAGEELERSGLGKYISDKSGEKQGAASYGAYEKITQDQAAAIDGRLTGIHTACIENTGILKALNSTITLNLPKLSTDIAEMRTLAIDAWSELNEINKNTKLIRDTNTKLDVLINNTNRL